MTQFQHNMIQMAIRNVNYSPDFRAELSKALHDLYESSVWRPISEAPRDRKRYELCIAPWDPTKKWVTIGRWIDNTEDIYDEDPSDGWEPGWYEDPVAVEGIQIIYPTHYRPLSKPPKEVTGE